MTDDSTPEATAGSAGGWPPSNYPILVATLLLVGAAFAPVLATEAAVAPLATAAYVALAVGVGLRVVELAAGERDRPVRPGRVAGVGSAVSHRLPDGAVGRWLQRLVPVAVVVGVLLVGWWWLTPGGAVPGAVLLGSGVALAAAAVSYLVSSGRRRRRS